MVLLIFMIADNINFPHLYEIEVQILDIHVALAICGHYTENEAENHLSS